MDKPVPVLTVQFETDEQLEVFIAWITGSRELTHAEWKDMFRLMGNLRRPNKAEAFLEVV